MIRLFRDLRRGKIPADDPARAAYSSWDEIEPDADDGSEDGDDSIHAARIHPRRPLHEGRDGVE